MTRHTTFDSAPLAAKERLLSAWQGFLYVDGKDIGSLEDAQRAIRAQNELIDACVACGMSPEDSEFEYAEKMSARFLSECD